LGGGDKKVTEAIQKQLDDSRRWVKTAAIEALGETGDPAAIEVLLAERNKARHPQTLAAIDDAVEKLRSNTDLDEVREQLESVRNENQALESRLKKLEEALSNRQDGKPQP
jgi:HEAT repeat protein